MARVGCVLDDYWMKMTIVDNNDYWMKDDY